MRTVPAAALAAAYALLAAATTTTNAHAQIQPMAAYWPHEDGRQWIYDQHYEDFTTPNEIVDNQARLYFEGTTTAPVGIAAQLLKGSIAWPPAPPARASDIPWEVTDPFLRRLWRARPDLRPGILHTVSVQPCLSNDIPDWYPLLLTGGLAYVQSATEIAAWRCNLSNTRAWLWMTSNLTPGSSAEIPLVPDLADDVILRLTVVGLEATTVPAGTFGDALRVDYLVDYGKSSCTSSTGEEIGTSRFETNGFVRYAPGVGPVECFEEFSEVVIDGEPCVEVPPSGPVSRSTLKLASPSVPARSASWGSVKSTYRE